MGLLEVHGVQRHPRRSVPGAPMRPRRPASARTVDEEPQAAQRLASGGGARGGEDEVGVRLEWPSCRLEVLIGAVSIGALVVDLVGVLV